MMRFFRALFGGRSLLTRLVKRGLFVVFLVAVTWGLIHLEAIRAANRMLQAEIASVEATDKRWKIADILADRPAVADADNSVLVMQKALALLPKKWEFIERAPDAETPPVFVGDELNALAVAAPLPPDLVERLKVLRGRYLPALEELRKLVSLERGRHTIVLKPSPSGILLDTVQDCRMVNFVLSIEAELNLHAGKPADAVENIREMLNVSRSLDGEPFMIPYLVRLSLDATTVRKVERLLHRSPPSEADLVRLEKLLAREEAELRGGYFDALRSERGSWYQELEAIRDGTSGNASPDLSEQFTGPIDYPRCQAQILNTMTELLESRKLPIREQAAAFGAIEARHQQIDRATATDRAAFNTAVLAASSPMRIAASYHRQTCHLRCCRAGLLAEAFRLHNRRLPASVEELCASLKVPLLTDPWDDKPLKWKADGEGVSVYSVGKDGSDDGGKRHPNNLDEAGYDLVFRIPIGKKAER